ncbi:MAG TPA: hypothetical protein VN867_15435 [Candidatus Binataceae bacterium]|nr:hypothetical protein [Candidatus Binataceae bacterium]
MAWPLKLRVTSFVIVIGVVVMETALALIPIGVALCYFAHIDAVRMFRDLLIVALALSIAIAIHGDLGRQGFRKWWRLRA